MIACPKCRGDTRVLETRDSDNLSYSRRRRACNKCPHRITTVEFVVDLDAGKKGKRLIDIAIVPRRDLVALKAVVASWTEAPVLPPEDIAMLEDTP